MDPLDKEKPWGVPGQLLIITIAISVIYLMIRFAVVIPEWGWQVVLPVTLVAAGVYFLLAFRMGFAPKRGVAPRRRPWINDLALLLLLMTATAPLVLIAYFLWADRLAG